MLDYGKTAGDAAAAGPPAGDRRGPARPDAGSLSLAQGLNIARRNTPLLLASALTCAVAALLASRALTPRYVATTQIYIDPRGLPGVDKDGAAPGQDSNGFINFVESQGLIITSQTVLEKVVASEKLDRDDEFVGSQSLLSHLTGAAQGERASVENVNAAAGALGSRIQVRRPERTFVIDLSVSSRDPAKAAQLANATARAFIEVQAAMQSDAARQTTASLTGRLESLRQHVLEAETKVEDFKAQNGLIGVKDQLVSDQQLKDMTAQISLARTRMEEARSKAAEIASARKRGGDVGALASGLALPSLTPLRGQQAEARQKLADLRGELGPRHPLVRDAEARVAEANRAVDAELARFARSVEIEYARARDLEASLGHELERLKKQSSQDGQTSVGLRDLERDAEAARNVYELFVTRSRETGDIQQVGTTSMKIISLATPPKARTYPPGAGLLTAAGLLLGLGLGLLGAILRERQDFRWRAASSRQAQREPDVSKVGLDDASREIGGDRSPPAPQASREPLPTAAAVATPALAISRRSVLEWARRSQTMDGIDLTGLGFGVLRQGADDTEFRKTLATLDLFRRPRQPEQSGVGLAIVGANEAGLRTALAINLALCATRMGARVALIDAAGRNARLTRAIRQTTQTPVLNHAILFDTRNGVLLGLPKAFDAQLGRKRPAELLRFLLNSRVEGVDLVICDGPDANEADAALLLDEADAIILVDERRAGADLPAQQPLPAPAQAKLRAIVHFEPLEQTIQRSA